MQKVIAKINLKAIKDNARAFKRLSGGKLCAVVKANAYGHGAVETVNALSGIADFFAVALLEEGIAIRTVACGKEILVLTPPTEEEEILSFIENGFSATVGDLKTARQIKRIAEREKKSVNVHLKVNTGMNRYGASLQLLGKICKLFSSTQYVCVVGLFSHLYADEKTAQSQKELFLRAKRIVSGYFDGFICHLSATFGSLLGQEYRFDAVRIGIGLYGYLPQTNNDRVNETGKRLKLKKAMRVYAKTLLTRTYSFGGLGYGECSKKERFGEKISVLRLGYADGFLRKKRNGTVGMRENANALCMDASIRFGKKHRGSYEPIMLDADETAKQTGTISYEVLCAATRRAEFVYEYE